jgi:hypothetical protein
MDKLLLQYFPGGAMRNTKNKRSPNLGFNPEPPEYETVLLPIHPRRLILSAFEI